MTPQATIGIAALVQKAVQLQVPVLFSDTCALLDLPRLLERKGSMQHIEREVRSARTTLAGSLENPATVLIAIPPFVPTEFADHIANASNSCLTWLKEIQSRLQRVRQMQLAMGVQESGRISNGRLEAAASHLRSLADRLMASGNHLSRDPVHSDAALTRVAQCLAPARKGKSEVKDCTIVEHLLDAAKQLRASGHAFPVVFLTSNTEDFGEPNAPRSPLDREFAGASIGLCATWSHAQSMLKI